MKKTQFKTVFSLLALFLVFGVFFLPYSAHAGFFDSIVGTSVSADDSTPDNISNSQTMQLLQPTVSPASVTQSQDPNALDPDTEVNTSGNSLVPDTSSMGPNSDDADASPDQMSVYVVKDGDTVAAVAKMFDVSVNTILWANDIKKGAALTPGDTIIILPVSGVQLTVAKGDTIKSIAKKYDADIADIASFNGIAEDASLTVGDQLIIPDGTINITSDTISTKKSSKGSQRYAAYYAKHPLPYIGGYFIDPVPGYRLSQGIHDDNAVDLAIAKGTPIRAAASGIVIFAKAGWNGRFGDLIIIDHPNGTETLYAHESAIFTHAGDHVSQGDIIGLVGATGDATGPHVHFEVHGAHNPGADDSWAQ